MLNFLFRWRAAALGVAAALFAAEAAAMAGRPPEPQQRAEAAPLPAQAIVETDVVLSSDQPLVFRQPVAASRPDTRAMMTPPGQRLLTIRFEDLDAPEGTLPLVRVFVGKPDANALTAIDDPHFAGAVSFFPLPMQEGQQAQLDIGPTLDRLRRMGDTADPAVTLVLAAPGRSRRETRALPEPATVRVTRFDLEGPR